MTRRHRAVRTAFAAVALAVVSISSAVGAGAQAVPEAEIVRTDLSEFPTVRLSVALSGESVVTDLDPDDVVVTENGEEIDAEVRGISDESLDVVLTIDVSGSMNGEPLAQAKVASLQFINELPDDARVGVVSFGNNAQLVSAFTTDRDASRNAINGLSSGGETALYDAVVLSSEQVAASDASRAALIVLSDGGDTVSETALDAAAASLEGTEAEFFAVSLQSGEADEAALNTLADAAEGSVVPATDPEALEEAYVDLGQRIANQYEIVFESVTDAPTATFAVTVGSTGSEASIEVALPDRAGGGEATDTTEAGAREITPLTGEGTAGVLEKSWALWVGALLVAVAIGVTAFVVLPDVDRPQRRSLRSDRAPVDDDVGIGERFVGSVRDTATRFTDQAVERSEQRASIDSALDRAGLVMRAGEFVAAVIGAAAVGGLLLFLLMGPVGFLIGVLVPILGASTLLNLLARRRNAKFADQLSDTLMLIAGSLRSGFGVGQAMDSVAEEMDDPIGAEFGRAVLETRLGRDMEDALEGIAKRVQNEDFEWVVDAMRIHRQVGGDLAQILDKVADTIRARNRLRRQISALTAEGRMSAIVLGMLPIGMSLVLYSTNPDYLGKLFESTAGWIMVAVAGGLLVAGVMWLRKLIDVEL